MKNHREMSAMEHINMLARNGLIKINGAVINIKSSARDDDGELEQVVIDYMVYAERHGYKVNW